VTGSAAELRVVDADARGPAPTTEVEDRILDAALVLVARWGVAKTALGDIAKEAGCSRATLYRAFPGGKQHLFVALATRELTAYRRGILDAIDAADELGDALTRALVVASRQLHDHDAAQFILEHEPELLLPFLGFHQVDVVYRETARVFGPHLQRFVAPDRAAWAAEWAARLFITYLFNPHERRDLAIKDDARSLVETFVLPALAPSDTTPRPI
jgi:AcrR family transcriptional regulator